MYIITDGNNYYDTYVYCQSSTAKLLINNNLREALLTLSALTNASFLVWGLFSKTGIFHGFFSLIISNTAGRLLSLE
jgi:hypothetical protein